MSKPLKVLLMAGTGEARALAARLAGDGRFAATASLAGATRQPEALPIPTRHGGFGGEAEHEKYLRENGFEAVVSATHPFASRIARRSQALCARLGIAHLTLLRPCWAPETGDAWTFIDSPAELAALAPEGSTLFVATGRGTLAAFAGLTGRRLICRVIDPPTTPCPVPGGEWLIGRPGDASAEAALFRRLGVDLVVTKASGGAGARAKLDAARALGLPVALIRRPPPPPGETVESAEAAFAWLEARL